MNVEQTLVEHGQAIAAHEQQIKTLFTQQGEIKELTQSTQSLALSVRELATKVANIDTRLQCIEDDDKHKRRTIWASVVSC